MALSAATRLSFCNNIEWLILSKALDRSNSIKADSPLLSIASNKKSLIIIIKSLFRVMSPITTLMLTREAVTLQIIAELLECYLLADL